ncbi:TetR family transcriptional regulator [Actinoplanes regularis]|uniref:Transcriptional regulator, TetR family n=1 Tax=Actinoplanes regularis TaxID=52697 RepID=A0A238W9U1_9ACTN|nr:TetR family transcriptional regulator [Actinoplanes regularis]GIE85139.1 TetR family transcriptional regulator [Actinoplanes regularis]GLW27327.1 TetR family transcriptional regulator [Actinoplanes regularis]SNR43054.1 transcriptional regulator, TetR family [Actinoplanes regularis]
MPPQNLPPRDAIRLAAGELFVRDGYGATTVRAIAAAAGCDPALVIRHFGSKEGLFLATVSVSGDLTRILAGPLESIGRELVRYVLDGADSPVSGVYRALLSASDRPEIKERLRASMHDVFVSPLAERVGGACPELRARLAAAQFAGLINAYWLVGDPVLGGAEHDTVVELYGEAIQSLLSGEDPTPRRG